MGRRSPVGGTDRGRTVGSRAPAGAIGAVAVVPTIQAAAVRRAEAGPRRRGPAIVAADLREPVKDALTGNLLVLAVDASGSMGTDDRMAAVKGALLGLLVDAYQRRDRVALVTFGGKGAEVVLRPTGSVEVARARLEALATGGETPLAEGIKAATVLAHRSATPNLRPLLVVVTDGRATSGAGVHAGPGGRGPGRSRHRRPPPPARGGDRRRARHRPPPGPGRRPGHRHGRPPHRPPRPHRRPPGGRPPQPVGERPLQGPATVRAGDR